MGRITSSSAATVFATIIVVRVANLRTGAAKNVFAMLDSGSDRDVICEDLVTTLNIPTREKQMTVRTVESQQTRHRRLASFKIVSTDSQYEATIRDAMVVDLRASASDVPPCRRDISKWRHLHDIKFDDTDG